MRWAILENYYYCGVPTQPPFGKRGKTKTTKTTKKFLGQEML
jgi:hypothetical protein